VRGLANTHNTGITQDQSDVGYPVMGAVADRDELQKLLERAFESSRRQREDQEYEEWLADIHQEARDSVELDQLDEDEQRVRDL
jgi:hypothetical protein